MKFEDESDAENLEYSDAESELADHLATWHPLSKLNDVTVMNTLSHSMSKFLRYTAHDLSLLDEDGWVDLEDALLHLQGLLDPTFAEMFYNSRTALACITKAVQMSDRDNDREPRFELYLSGSNAWIRATDGELYRARSHS